MLVALDLHPKEGILAWDIKFFRNNSENFRDNLAQHVLENINNLDNINFIVNNQTIDNMKRDIHSIETDFQGKRSKLDSDKTISYSKKTNKIRKLEDEEVNEKIKCAKKHMLSKKASFGNSYYEFEFKYLKSIDNFCESLTGTKKFNAEYQNTLNTKEAEKLNLRQLEADLINARGRPAAANIIADIARSKALIQESDKFLNDLWQDRQKKCSGVYHTKYNIYYDATNDPDKNAIQKMDEKKEAFVNYVKHNKQNINDMVNNHVVVYKNSKSNNAVAPRQYIR